MSILTPATPALDDPADVVDYRCGIISLDENAGHPLTSELFEDLLINPALPQMRVATIEVNLSAEQPGELAANLIGGKNPAALHSAATIQKANADVVLLTGFDADETAARIFNDEYLKVAQPKARATDYPYRYVGPTNRGVASGADLNHDKIIGGAQDAWGQGEFPGQGSMVLLSKHPIDQQGIRTITTQRWAGVPSSKVSEAGLSQAVAEAMPVMESGLWDVPLKVAGQEVRIVAVQVSPNSEEISYSELRRSDQLSVIGDWISAEQYLRDDHGAAPESDKRYVVLGELGEGPQHNAEVDRLIAKLGVAEQGIHDATSYILADEQLQIIRHGSIDAGDDDASSGPRESAELLWSDLKL